MDELWYEKEEVRNQLILFGRAIQGRAPYRVVIEPDPTLCHSGSCNFDTRTITVNPLLFSVLPREQYLLTKALLVHEAGHRRHTIPTALPGVIRDIANVLEDERVEQRMCEEFSGVEWLIHKLARQFYAGARLIDSASDSPDEVSNYFLQWRWGRRIGLPVKGGLSAGNQQRWEKVKPLVLDAWQAKDSTIVNRHAVAIANILYFSDQDDATEQVKTMS